MPAQHNFTSSRAARALGISTEPRFVERLFDQLRDRYGLVAACVGPDGRDRYTLAALGDALQRRHKEYATNQ